MADMRETKRRMRETMERLRKEIPAPVREEASAAICRHLFGLCENLAGGRALLTIMSFMPFRGEVDVLPLTRNLWAEGYLVAMPKIDRGTNRMKVYLVKSMADMEPGACGIMEPKKNCALVQNVSIDLVVMPGLAFDRAGGRLGYGGGYYDRFFRDWMEEGLKIPTKVGVCYDRQLADKIPMEIHDCRVDCVVTEQGILEARPKSS